jgi:hypothetical protein
MDRHFLDRPLASELSYRVLELRRQRGELGPCDLDCSNQRIYPLPSQFVVREAFIADRKRTPDSFQGERAPYLIGRKG